MFMRSHKLEFMQEGSYELSSCQQYRCTIPAGNVVQWLAAHVNHDNLKALLDSFVEKKIAEPR